jgi:hypothetical protein
MIKVNEYFECKVQFQSDSQKPRFIYLQVQNVRKSWKYRSLLNAVIIGVTDSSTTERDTK